FLGREGDIVVAALLSAHEHVVRGWSLVVNEVKYVVPNQRLSEERISRGWSQAYVAKQIDAYAFMVHRWEYGQTFPGPRYRQKLLQLFNKSAEELGLVPWDTEFGR